MRGSPRALEFIFGKGKLEWLGLQYGEGRMMIDSVVWAQYINVTDTQTDTQTHRQPRRRSKWSANAWRRAARIVEVRIFETPRLKSRWDVWRTRLVSWLSIMKLWTCFSARVSSSLRARTATTSAVHPEPCTQTRLCDTIRIRDAISTCAQKPTWVSLIHRTETTTKKCKTEKNKEVKTDMLRSNSLSSLGE